LKLANSLIESYVLKVEGPEDQASNVSDSLIEKIGGMKPWYAFLAKASLLGIGVSITAFLANSGRIPGTVYLIRVFAREIEVTKSPNQRHSPTQYCAPAFSLSWPEFRGQFT
jgi:hypothetical protein